MLEIYQEIVNTISNGGCAALATIVTASGSVPRELCAKMLIREDGSFIGTIGGGGAELKVINLVSEVIKSKKPRILHFDMSGKGEKAAMICGGIIDVLIEPILSTDILYLFGAGHISEVTTRIAKMLDFSIVIIDPRPEYNNKERFPDALTCIVDEYESVFQTLSIKPGGYIVIFTTGHLFDEQCLNFSLKTDAPSYIGMIGSKKKAKDVKERLIRKGVSPEKLQKVNSPVGLKIGAQTPAEIAVSILAEIIKVKRLKDSAPIVSKTNIDIHETL